MVFLSYFSSISYKMKIMQFKKGISVGTFTLQSIILSQQILMFNKVKVKNASTNPCLLFLFLCHLKFVYFLSMIIQCFFLSAGESQKAGNFQIMHYQ